jgi:hypothetical protein
MAAAPPATPATPVGGASGSPRVVRIVIRGDRAGGAQRGLLGPDPRLRTLRRVLVTYPAVRHILPDRISLDATADPRVLDTVARFLERQQWLLTSVIVE